MSKKQEENIILNSIEVIDWLVQLLDCKEYEKKLPYPKFNIQEFCFIRDLIFSKPKGLLFFYLADQLMNRTALRDLPMFNAPSMKKLNFICNFMNGKGGADAARRSGFSVKTAKQQAWRILREINGYKRNKME